MATYVLADPIFCAHETGSHPERPLRLTRIHEHLEARGYLGEGGSLQPVAPRLASDAELERAHDAHVHQLCEQLAAAGGGMIDADTICGPRSAEVARLAAGGACALAEAVLADPAERAAGIALVRPPGHHATPERSMGFCLYNNVAVVAQHLRQTQGVERLMIVDWDVHHGNGTQDIFYDDPSVIFVSSHRYPFYPGTGSADERGAGRGEGATINLPLPASTPPESLIGQLADAVGEASARHQPELILLSAGFDAYHRDPIGGLNLDIEHFAELSHRILEIAAETPRARVISLLEGGYHTDDLPLLVEAHLEPLTRFAESPR